MGFAKKTSQKLVVVFCEPLDHIKERSRNQDATAQPETFLSPVSIKSDTGRWFSQQFTEAFVARVRS